MTNRQATTEPAPDPVDAVTIGETMAGLVSRNDRGRFVAVTAGAESNVATGMARLGCRTRWVSRLGRDPLGRWIAETVSGSGVEVAIEWDDDRPTGILTKHVADSRSLVQYYRSGSAASALSVADMGRMGRSRVVHLTGITPALSGSAAQLVRTVIEDRAGGGGRVSFDVNYRPALWPEPAAAASALLPLAQRADVIFIGDDEAAALFGTADPDALAALILRRGSQELVVKQGGAGATGVTANATVSVPGLPADVVDPTGAGDGFAAGYLAASLWDWPLPARLRLGHVLGSRVVTVIEDTVPPFTEAELGALSPETLAQRWT